MSENATGKDVDVEAIGYVKIQKIKTAVLLTGKVGRNGIDS